MTEDTAKYRVVYQAYNSIGQKHQRKWKLIVTTPYASGDTPTTIRRFKRKRNAVTRGKELAKKHGERLAVNRRNGGIITTHEFAND